MDSEQENRIAEEGRHAELVASSGAEQKSGEHQRAALQSEDVDLPGLTLREAPVSALRRSAERRQTSALIAWWGEVERRTGDDRRASPSDNGIDHD